MALFDRSLKGFRRHRTVLNSDLSRVFFYELGIKGLLSRLQSVVNKSYEHSCFIGPLADLFINPIIDMNFLNSKAFTIIDNNKASLEASLEKIKDRSKIKVTGICLDEELWGFPNDYFDLIINNMQLHWVNQVHQTAEKWLKSLKPDGTLIGTSLGGDTLQELRIALSLAEQEREGGISTHVSPMLHITDIGQVLIRLDYKLVTANADANTLYFDDSFALMNFLQAIGENNAVHSRRHTLNRETFVAADAIYRGLFTEKTGEFAGKIPATFELVHFIGWKEHPSQRKPLKRGTKGIDIKTLAEEIDDSDMEQLEIKELENDIEVKNVQRKTKK